MGRRWSWSRTPCSPPVASAWLTGHEPLPYTERVLGKSAAAFVFSAILLAGDATPPAFAEHAVPYRFTVLGYLKDAKGSPRPGIQVEITRVKTGLSYLGETDKDGLFVIVTRLGDESAGERLDLRAGGQSTAIVARFDAADHVRERGTRVDFVGPTVVERPTWFQPTLKRFLGQ